MLSISAVSCKVLSCSCLGNNERPDQKRPFLSDCAKSLLSGPVTRDDEWRCFCGAVWRIVQRERGSFNGRCGLGRLVR